VSPRFSPFTTPCLLGALALLPGFHRLNGAPAPPEFVPFLETHCFDCHDADAKKGGIDLTSADFDPANPASMRLWVRVHDQISDGEMPPKKKTQPVPAEGDAFLARLSDELATRSRDLAVSVMRRLNRVEYEHTINDMLGTRESLADLLPADGKAHGFDNIGEALDISAVHLERYLEAARTALDAAIRKSPRPETSKLATTLAKGNEGYLGKQWQQAADGAVLLFNSGLFPRPMFTEFKPSVEGRYRVKVTGYAHQTGEPVTFELWSGQAGRGFVGRKLVDAGFAPGEPQTVTAEVWMKAGDKLLLLPGLKRGAVVGKDGQKPGLAVLGLEAEGPIIEQWPPPGHELLLGGIDIREATREEQLSPKAKNPGRGKAAALSHVLVSTNPAGDAKRLLHRFLPVAFRRPVDDADVKPLLDLVTGQLADGANFEDAMRLAYVTALCSPDFLFLKEPPGRLDDFALAARLSYAFWNTLPDARLAELAAKKQLSQPATLHAETERLLRDPRAGRFVSSFTGQWLNLREIDFTTPDSQLYPEFDDTLQDAMVAETEAFFAEILDKNLSLLNFIHSDWTMLNGRLARHYGIPGVSGPEMRRVSLEPESHRGGVLTQASVLKVSANGTTTSPVVRGVFVLERILGIEPPPPPPNVPGIEPDIRGAITLRQQLEKHRQLESCAGCHQLIDPPGFALENYDVMGGWRTHYRSLNKEHPAPGAELTGGQGRVPWRVGPAVDAAGETRDGSPFTGLEDYKQLLLAEPEKRTLALAEKFATYACGRPMGFADRAELTRIARSTAAKKFGFRDLIHEVIQSGIFLSK